MKIKDLKKKFLLLVCLFFVLKNQAQIGGATTYNFLRLASSARLTALGETNISVMNFDPSFQLANPALLNSSMHKTATFSTAIYPGGINYGNINYAHHFKKINATFGFGLQYIAYGNIPQTNEQAEIIGKFTSGEMALYAGGSYQFGKLFSVGANAKFIYSGLSSSYNSVGAVVDFGATVHDKKNIVVASLVAKNIGGQIKPYTKGVKEAMPFDLQAGISVNVPVAPITIHYTLHDLHRWNIRYYNPADAQNQNLFGDTTTTTTKSGLGDEIMRHMIFGLGINIKKIVYLDAAYNHQRRMEIKQDTRRGMAGISLGVGVKVKMVNFHLGISPMPLKQTLAHFTLGINFDAIKKKGTVAAPKS